jgi:protein-tyrosine phosphatase
VEPRFVDCHSHVVASGDDGAKTLQDGLELCDLAADSGTAILFATPHVWPHLPLTEEREREVRRAYERLKTRVRLELRLGFELTPAPPLLREDPARYVLEGTDVVLVEMPFPGPASDLVALAEHIERAGLIPLVAHPERTDPILKRPELAHELAKRWPLQVNASSLAGRHGDEIERLAWRLVEAGDVAVVASDGHRLSRPARLDEAYDLVRTGVGEERALPLFDGSALNLSSARPTPSRAAARGA